MTEYTHGGVAACLVTSHFWCGALAVLSTTAELVATISGAIIGVVTLYRMWHRKYTSQDKRVL